MHYPVLPGRPVALAPPSDTIQPGLGLARRALISGLALVAAAISAYLASVSLSGGSVAGCGGEGVDCDHVLSTRWGAWLGLPVAIPAAAIYGSLAAAAWFLGPAVPAAVRRLAWVVVLGLATLAAGAGVWFAGLQLVAVGKICTLCMATHACGLAVAAIAWWSARGAGGIAVPFVSAGAGLAALAVLIAGQALHEPVRFEVTRVDDDPVPALAEKPADTPEPELTRNANEQPPPSGESQPTTTVTAGKVKTSRPLAIAGSGKKLDAYEHPIIGSPDAERVIVKLFDYTCHHCRTQHLQLEEARRHFGDHLAVVVLPVPMNRACNPHATGGDGGPHAKACVYARLALAVWREDRTKFAQFHHWLFTPETPPSPEEARQYAKDLLGDPGFRAAYDDWRLSEQLGVYVALYGELGRGRIPKLLDEKMKVEGDFSSAGQLIETLEKEWGRK